MFKKISLLRPLLLILIIFIPLYPKFPLTNVTGTYVAIRLDDIIVTIAIAIWALYQLFTGFPVLKKKITWIFIAYYLAIFASFLAAVFIYKTDPVNILLLHFLRRLEYTSLFFIALSALEHRLSRGWVYAALLVATSGVIAYGYGQKYWQLPVVSTMNSEFSKGQLLQMDVWTRISSTFAGHYDLAAYLSIVLIIIAGVAVTAKNKLVAAVSFITWLLSYHQLTLTASRVSIVAFYGASVLLFILLKKFFWIVPLTLFFFFGITSSKDLNQRLLATIPAFKKQIVVIQNPGGPTLPPPTATPTSTPGPVAIVTGYKPLPTIIRHGPVDEFIPIDVDAGVARSGEIRFNVEWPRAVTAWRKNLILGTGLGSLTLATDNDYLRSLGESGILGFATFFLIFIYFTFWTIRRPRPLNLIFFAAMTGFLANATLIDVFEASKTAYLFWILMAAYYHSLHEPA